MWIWVSRATGLPKVVCKQDFQPTVGPRGTTIGSGDWQAYVPVSRLIELRAENAQLRAVVEDFLASFPKHYQGFPGKLEWSEIHRLRQALSAPEESP